MNKKIVAFLTFTFSLTWLLWWPLAFLKQDDSQIYRNTVFFILFAIAGAAPTIAAYISIKFSDRDYTLFNKAVWKWRINLLYYLFVFISILVVRLLSILVYGLIYKPIWTELSPHIISFVLLIFPMIIFGGLEEFGWRGILLPELNRKFNLLISALIVGFLWGLWHLPLFFINGLSQYHTNFLTFLINTIGLSFVLAWFFHQTNSILICVLFHAFYNSSFSIGLDCPSNGQYISAIIWLIYGGMLLGYEYVKTKKKSTISFLKQDRLKLKKQGQEILPLKGSTGN